MTSPNSTRTTSRLLTEYNFEAMLPTKKELDQYRAAVIEELKKLPVYAGKNPANWDDEIEVVKNLPDNALINAMEYNTPKEYAEMRTM